jgi:hypothetical protein
MSRPGSFRCISGRVVTVLAVVGSTACHTRASLPVPTRSSVSPSSVVTWQAFGRIVRQGTLLEALERLRPSMLVARGGRLPLVSVDGAPPTDLSLLRTIPASVVSEVRLQRASSSVGHSRILPNGDTIVGDVIVVTTLGGVRRGR